MYHIKKSPEKPIAYGPEIKKERKVCTSICVIKINAVVVIK
jgi:hypothetical protein